MLFLATVGNVIDGYIMAWVVMIVLFRWGVSWEVKVPTVFSNGLVKNVNSMYDCNVDGGVFIKIPGCFMFGIMAMGVDNAGIICKWSGSNLWEMLGLCRYGTNESGVESAGIVCKRSGSKVWWTNVAAVVMVDVVWSTVLYQVNNAVLFTKSQEISAVTFNGATVTAVSATVKMILVGTMGGVTVVTSSWSGTSWGSMTQGVKVSEKSVSSCSGLKAEIWFGSTSPVPFDWIAPLSI